MNMPFGKHRGEEIGTLPDGYLIWLLHLDDLPDRNENLYEALMEEAESRGLDPFDL